jgi:hypothetical protein
MNVVTEEDRLARPLEVTGIADDWGFVPGRRCGRSRLDLLTVHGRKREGEDQHHDRS